MSYHPHSIVTAYGANAEYEDTCEQGRSLRVELPRHFIQKYIRSEDQALDAGGGTGFNTILMAQRCQKVTHLDITPEIAALAEQNVRRAGLEAKIDCHLGDICDLSRFNDAAFSFVVCVGDAISYVLDQRFQAMHELVRVARPGAILVIGCDAKYGFMRLALEEGRLDQALDIHQTHESTCALGLRTHVYTVQEMTELIQGHGCEVLEVASTPTLTDTVDRRQFYAEDAWGKLTDLELQLCTQPELLGMGNHLLFIARKR